MLKNDRAYITPVARWAAADDARPPLASTVGRRAAAHTCNRLSEVLVSLNDGEAKLRLRHLAKKIDGALARKLLQLTPQDDGHKLEEAVRKKCGRAVNCDTCGKLHYRKTS